VSAPSVAPSTFAVELAIARTPESVGALRAGWEPLQATPASDVDLYLFEIGGRPNLVRPHVLALSRGAALVTVAAGWLEQVRLASRIAYRNVFAPPVRAITVQPGGIVGEISDETAAAIVSSLYGSLAQGEADVAILHEVAVAAPFLPLARTIPSAAFRDRAVQQNVRWIATFPQPPDAPFPSSSHARRNLRYYANRLRRRYGGDIDVRSYTRPADLDVLCRDVDLVAATTYQRRLGVGFRVDPFYRERMRHQMERGAFRSWVLYLAGLPCAFWLGIRWGDTYYSGDTGYDPAFRDDRLGDLLLMRAAEDLRRESGLRFFDFGFGDAEYKRRYGSRSIEEATVVMYAPTARGMALAMARGVVGGTNRLLKSAARRLDVLDTVRSAVRRRLERGQTPWGVTPT